MKTTRIVVACAATLSLSILATGGCSSGGCSSNCDASGMASPNSAMNSSLFDRLGREPAIKAVVDDFVGRAASDPKVNFTRKGTSMEWEATPANVEHLKMRLVEFVAMASGGPQKYMGRSMQSAHRGMNISNAEFDAIAADLKASLDHFKVPAREQAELLAAVEGTRKDIVERR
jgi:hemoglobin